MSAGYPQLTKGIPVGKPVGMETCGLELLVITSLHRSRCCKYLPQVLARHIFIFTNVIYDLLYYPTFVVAFS